MAKSEALDERPLRTICLPFPPTRGVQDQLAREAYEAYTGSESLRMPPESLGSGKVTKWSNLPFETQQAWRAASLAVFASLRKLTADQKRD